MIVGRTPRSLRRVVVVLLAGALVAGVASPATAQANSVSPSCIPTLSTPVTIKVDDITSPGGLFKTAVDLGLAAQPGPPAGQPFAVFLGRLSDETFTPALMATAIFDTQLLGPPFTSGFGEVVTETAFGGGEGIGPLQVGGCAPVVDSISPPDGATGVARTSVVFAVFSQAMDPASTGAAFTVVRARNGRPVAGNVKVVLGDRVAVFQPHRRLRPHKRYTATITTAAKDHNGINLTTTKTWSFTTG